MSRRFLVCDCLMLVVCGLLVSACDQPTTKTKTARPADGTPAAKAPGDNPEWVADAPQYARPAEEPKPEPAARPDDPLHYFTNKKIVMVRRPTGYRPEDVPRVAIWWTDNNGYRWRRAGYFGREQDFFPFTVTEDGDYGIRFVGPGQAAAMQNLPAPQRVYHVDTIPPIMEASVAPDQTWYGPGQGLTISWRARDPHLVDRPIRISMLNDFAAGGPEATELYRDLDAVGNVTYTIPDALVDHTVRFRVDALDRAGNMGMAVSHGLQIIDKERYDRSANSLTSTSKTTPESSSAPPSETESPEGWNDVAAAPEQGSTRNAAANDAAPDAAPSAGWERFRDDATKLVMEQVARIQASLAQAGPAGSVAAEPTPESSSPRATSSPMFPPSVAHVTASAEIAPQAVAVECPPEEIDITALPLATLVEGAADGYYDPTQGNGLVAPLPATVASGPGPARDTAHPWRTLCDAADARTTSDLWRLPTPQFGAALRREYEGRFFAERRAVEPLAEPQGNVPSMAGAIESDGLPRGDGGYEAP